MLLRRLYLQIYATIIGSLIAVAVVSGVLWSTAGPERFFHDVFDVTGRLAQDSLPPADAPRRRQRAVIVGLSEELDVGIILYDRDGVLIASHGTRRQPPERISGRRNWRGMRRGRLWALPLPDGRRLVVDFGRRGGRHPLLNLLMFLSSVALVVGLGAYPFVRRLTRRLETLQKGVERIGAGDLAARVDVQGRDEVARLATSFNEAAEKIDQLVGAHRMLLANASHELRTPLSRIRLGVEMLKGDADDERRAALRQDIAELDQLIDEILLMSRLDSGVHAELSESVDLVALAAEECSRSAGCALTGSAPEIVGDSRLLRRLIRNLLDNAAKHGAPPVAVSIVAGPDGAVLTVRDGGPGIAEADREKVFQPFFRAADRQNVGGYGLGLPLVRQIAEAHGGTAVVLPARRAGAAVRVTLPYRPATATAM